MLADTAEICVLVYPLLGFSCHATNMFLMTVMSFAWYCIIVTKNNLIMRHTSDTVSLLEPEKTDTTFGFYRSWYWECGGENSLWGAEQLHIFRVYPQISAGPDSMVHAKTGI